MRPWPRPAPSDRAAADASLPCSPPPASSASSSWLPELLPPLPPCGSSCSFCNDSSAAAATALLVAGNASHWMQTALLSANGNRTERTAGQAVS